MPCCWPPTEIAATSARPPVASAAWVSACHQASGCTCVPAGCGADPDRSRRPVSASARAYPKYEACAPSGRVIDVRAGGAVAFVPYADEEGFDEEGYVRRFTGVGSRAGLRRGAWEDVQLVANDGASFVRSFVRLPWRMS